MDRKELKQQYDELLARIKTARMFDGRNKGVDIYVCENCGAQFYTRYKDKGVTPFTIRCRYCGNGTMKHENTITEQFANDVGFEVHNWVRPTFNQLQNLSDGAIDHVLNGGLMLEDELNDEETLVKATFNKVHELLDSLQETGATCLFVSDEGNHFLISGNPTNITAQIVFAMCRYPVVRQIIQKCADNYEELNNKFGDKVRNITMDHLIEQNSGNDENK